MNHYIVPEIKERLYSYMREKNVTSSDLCRVLNVAYPDLKATLEGKSPLYNKWQKKISEALDVNREELFKEFYSVSEQKNMDIAYNQAVIDYKEELLKRLIPHLNDFECAKESETYLAITEIANELLK